MMRLLGAADEGSSIASASGAFTPVDSSDPRETRPKLPDMTDEDMAEIDQKFAKRKAARRDRIAKRYGEREAQIDEASDVVPTRDTPFWYAVKVSGAHMGTMQCPSRLSQSLPSQLVMGRE